MPAPTFKLTQTIPTCPDTPLRAADETNLSRGNVEVNADCCRRYGTTVRIGAGLPTTTLYLESSVPTCSGTGVGTKVYSGDAVRICGTANGGTRWTITLPDDPAPSFGNPWLEAEIAVTISGGLLGSPTLFSALAVDITSQGGMTAGASSLQSDINAAAGSPGWVAVAGNYNGGAGRTFTFTFASSVPSGLSDTSSIVYNNDESGEASLSGPSTASTEVMAYYRCDWSSCGLGGVVVTQRLSDDDSIIATYTNAAFCVKSGLRTILNRQSTTCNHPCINLRTLQQIQGTLPSTLCFEATPTQATCLGGIRALSYTATIDNSPSPITDMMDGDSASGPAPIPPIVINGSETNFTPTEDITLTGRLVVTGVSAVNPGLYEDVELALHFGDVLPNVSWNVSVNACGPAAIVSARPYAAAQVNWTANINISNSTTTAQFTGGTPAVSGVLAGAHPMVDAFSLVAKDALADDTDAPSFNYCDQDATLQPSMTIGVSGSRITINFTVGVVWNPPDPSQLPATCVFTCDDRVFADILVQASTDSYDP